MNETILKLETISVNFKDILNPSDNINLFYEFFFITDLTLDRLLRVRTSQDYVYPNDQARSLKSVLKNSKADKIVLKLTPKIDNQKGNFRKYIVDLENSKSRIIRSQLDSKEKNEQIILDFLEYLKEKKISKKDYESLSPKDLGSKIRDELLSFTIKREQNKHNSSIEPIVTEQTPFVEAIEEEESYSQKIMKSDTIDSSKVFIDNTEDQLSFLDVENKEGFSLFLQTLKGKAITGLSDIGKQGEDKELFLNSLKRFENKLDKLFLSHIDHRLEAKKVASVMLDRFDEIQGKGNVLKKSRELKPLRDGIDIKDYELLMLNAASNAKRMRTEQTAQLRIIYTLLYLYGLRLNEVAPLTYENIVNAIQTGELNILHTKTKEARKHIMGIKGRQMLKSLEPEINILFKKSNFEYLGSSCRNRSKIKCDKAFISYVNNDISSTCECYKINKNLSSHSFRVNYLTQLLKTVSVHKAAEFIGHKSIQSTLKYNRHSYNKEEQENILDNIFFTEN